MKRRARSVALGVVLVLAGGVPIAGAGPTPGGLASDTVEWVAHLPFVIDGVGGRLVGNYFYATDQNKLMIFDVGIPEVPLLVGVLPIPQELIFNREDLDTNGTILIYPVLNEDDLVVVDVTIKSAPIILAVVVGGGGHTASCALNCTWAYSSDGALTDLRDPAHPVLVRERGPGSVEFPMGHDVEEVAPGFVVTSRLQLFDVRSNQLSPTVLADRQAIDRNSCWHSARWPRKMADRFALCSGESNFTFACGPNNGGFSTWDTTNWQQSGTFRLAGEYHVRNGNVLDGNPPFNALGCSAHWFDAHPSFNNGGLVASAWYEHGIKFLRVASGGTISEAGYFLPFGGSPGAVYWISDRILYVTDYLRGMDILRYTGPL